jgi:hypothetical protein
MANGAVVTTTEIDWTSVKLLQFTWQSGDAADDDAGAAAATSTAVFSGDIIGLATVPDAVSAPTADYDVVITDSRGLDVLLGAGADRHTSNTEYVAGTSLGAVVESTLTLGVTNAGNVKKGDVYLWIR